jgi:hypothetical protein
MDAPEVYPTTWDMDTVAWDPRTMALVPEELTTSATTANENAKNATTPKNGGKRGSKRTGKHTASAKAEINENGEVVQVVKPRPSPDSCALSQPVCCNHPGCTQLYRSALHTAVRPSSVYCPTHRPSASQEQQISDKSVVVDDEEVGVKPVKTRADSSRNKRMEKAASSGKKGGSVAGEEEDSTAMLGAVTGGGGATRRGHPRKAASALPTTSSGVKRATGWGGCTNVEFM